MQMFSAPWDGAWRKLTVTAFFFKRSVRDVRPPHPEQICTSDLWAKIKTFSPRFWLVLFGENTYLQISNINEITEPLYWATNLLWWYKGHNSTLPGSFTLVSKCKICYKSMNMNFQRIHIWKNLLMIHDNLTQSARLPSSRRRNRRHPANPWLLNNPRPFHHPPRLPPEQKSLQAISVALNPARCHNPLHCDTHLASHLVCRQAITHEGVQWALQRVSISILCNIKMTPGHWVKNIKSVSQSTFAFFFTL